MTKVWESEEGLITAKAVHMEDREEAVTGRANKVETRMVTLEIKVDERGTFQPT